MYQHPDDFCKNNNFNSIETAPFKIHLKRQLRGPQNCKYVQATKSVYVKSRVVANNCDNHTYLSKHPSVFGIQSLPDKYFHQTCTWTNALNFQYRTEIYFHEDRDIDHQSLKRILTSELVFNELTNF